MLGKNENNSTNEKSTAIQNSGLSNSQFQGEISGIPPDEQFFIFMLIPPDGGYAWIILLISFTISACVDGMLLTVGAVLDAVSKDLHLSTSEATSLSSIQNAIYLFSGPIVCAIANNIGFRIPAVAGGTIGAIGILTGSFCNNWLCLFFTYGVLVGIGFGFISSPNSLIVGHYFDKYRTIAFGISSSGVGAGTIVFSFLNVFLLNYLSWRNTLRVYFGLCIFLSCISLLFRPIKPVNIRKLEITTNSDESLASESVESIIFLSRFGRFDDELPKIEAVESQQTTKPELSRFRRVSLQWKNTFCEKLQFLCSSQCCKKRDEDKETTPQKPTEGRQSARRFTIEKRPLFREDIFLDVNIPFGSQHQQQQGEQTNPSLTSDTKQHTPITAAQSRQTGTIYVKHTGQEHATGKIHTVKSVPKSKKFNMKKFYQKLFQIPPPLKKAFHMLFDISIFRVKSIRFFLASGFFLMLANIVPFLFVEKHGQVNGIPKEITNWFITTLGITNLIFRIVGGLLVTYSKNLNPIYVPASFLLLSGIFTLLAGIIGHSSVAFQFVWIIVFGIGSAIFMALRSSIMVHCVGIEKLTNCYGISMLVLGIGTFLGTTFAGVLVSITDSYDAAFLFAGCGIILSALLLFVTGFITKIEKRK